MSMVTGVNGQLYLVPQQQQPPQPQPVILAQGTAGGQAQWLLPQQPIFQLAPPPVNVETIVLT